MQYMSTTTKLDANSSNDCHHTLLCKKLPAYLQSFTLLTICVNSGYNIYYCYSKFN